MLSIEQLAERLGLSVDQTRRLVDALGSVLAPFRTRGEKNAILVDQGGLAILERARDLKSRGVAYSSLADQIETELSENSDDGHKPASQTTAEQREPACEGCQARDELIRELRSDKEWLRSQLADAQTQIRELEQKALPNPDRRPWWQRLLGANG